MMVTDFSPIIEAQHLTKRVNSAEGELTILNDINFQVAAASAVAVVGVSGSGKSTLLGLLAGLDTPSAGHVILDGTNLNQLDEDGRAEHRAGRVGFVFQSFQLLPSLTALENVMLPLELAGDPSARDAARELLARVGLQDRNGHYPSQLSGGEQQRCAIARAFAANPKILFADEPTGNLDQRTGTYIIELLLALNQEQATTLVMVTHDTALATQCDAQLELDAGKVVNWSGDALRVPTESVSADQS